MYAHKNYRVCSCNQIIGLNDLFYVSFTFLCLEKHKLKQNVKALSVKNEIYKSIRRLSNRILPNWIFN